MMSSVLRAGFAVAAAVIVAACGGTPQTPTSPSAAAAGTLTAASDGSTLKVTAPALVAPIGGARVDSLRPTLTWAAVSGTFAASGVSPTYDVEVATGGQVVFTATVETTSFAPTTNALNNTEYTWRVRARQDGATGPWSAAALFMTPQANTGGLVVDGFRTPDPPAGSRLGLPVETGIVNAQYNQNFNDWVNSCQDTQGERGWIWLDKLIDALRAKDLRWGYNGKRGNPNDPSKDIIDYHYGAGSSQFSTSVYIIDVMNGHCGNTPGPTWIDQTAVTVNSGTVGMFIYPRPGRTTVTGPSPTRGLPDLSGILVAQFSNASDSCPNGLKYVNNPWQDRVIDTFRQIDQRWGYNAKPTRTAADNNGVPVVAAGDEAAYHWGDGARQGSTEVHLVDLLTGHCGPTPTVGWRVFTGEEPGRWTGAGRF
jgi:hypothetical protein